MKIMELLFKSQPSTLPKVKEQRGAAIKKGMATVDVVVIDCTTLFEQAMELVMTLQEYPNLQKLNNKEKLNPIYVYLLLYYVLCIYIIFLNARTYMKVEYTVKYH